MREKISINFRKSEKLFRNFIKDLRKRAANEAMKNEMMIELNQKKMK